MARRILLAAVAALLACGVLAGGPLAVGLAHLAPLVALGALLLAGRYPGARALAGRGGARRPRAPGAPPRLRPRRARTPLMARGGLLIARALAVRPPPLLGLAPPATAA